MSSPIERAIEMFQLNLQALELREQFYEFEKAFFDQMGWSFKALDAMFGFSRQRRHRQAVERLNARRGQYERAIRELNSGRTDFAVIQLQQMAREALNPKERIGFWRRLSFDSLMYHLPKPLAPGVSYGYSSDSKTFIAIVQLLQELPQR